MAQPKPYIILFLALFTLGLFLLSGLVPDYNEFPDKWIFSPTTPMNEFMNGFVVSFGAMFQTISWLLEWPVIWARKILAFLPWSITTAIFATFAFVASGMRLSIFVSLSFLYMAAIGYWGESMNTLAVVLISVPLSLIVGFVFGVWGTYSNRTKAVILSMLDFLQAIPAFAYLLPILILFEFSTSVGLVASILYAFPLIARSTIHGLGEVPVQAIEGGVVSGATRSQVFWKIRFPAAKNKMLLGVNQTAMAALSMAVIASVIGSTNDIGWELLSSLRNAQYGESILTGVIIALIAISLDRITLGFAIGDKFKKPTMFGFNAWFIGLYAIVILMALSLFFPLLHTWPAALSIQPAPAMNAMLEPFLTNSREWIEAIKNSAFAFIILPIKFGLPNAITPSTWGFEFSQPVLALYLGVNMSLVIWTMWREWYSGAAVIALTGVVFYIGMINLPWLALFGIIFYAAYVSSGAKLALGAGLGMGFLMITGIWPQAVLSLYLAGIAVAISSFLGTLIGICASENKTLSAILKPILRALQVMPFFVFLIPFVMVFKIGEFTALLAIIAYAIVPVIRYTEYGLRNLPEETLEAAKAIGSTRWQLLKRIKLPLAFPAIMFGLNQSIINAAAMLVITALVGASGLGNQVYNGLANADFGIGLTAGLGVAILTLIADRMTKAISRRKQKEYGLQIARL